MTSPPRLAYVAGFVVAACVVVVIALETIRVANPTTRLDATPLTIELVGNQVFSTPEIRAELAPLETPLIDDTGAVDDDSLRREVLLIEAFYWDRGHANAKVGTPRFERWRNAIVIPVEEGPSFTIDTVTVTGRLLGDEAHHLAMIHVRPGDRFSRTTIAEDRQTLVTLYEDQAYAFVDVRVASHVDLARRTIGLAFEIEPGKPAAFERIDIINSTKTSDATIRRAVTVAADQPYNSTRLVETKRRISALGGKTVAISTKRGSKDALIVATIEISGD